MNTTPPFDPPYTTMTSTPNGARYVETRADGTEQVVGAPIIPTARPVFSQPAKPSKPAAQMAKSVVHGGAAASLFLDVPFAEKDNVKRLGAKWDSAMRKWYVPHGVDVNLFSLWWPNTLKQEAKLLGQL